MAQCRQVADNKRENIDERKVTENNTSTRKLHLQLKISEDFDMCIKSMNSLCSYTTNEERLIQLIQQSSNTIKNALVHIGGKLSELPNQRGDKVSREII